MGLDCDSCANGYNDEDHDGICMPDCGGGTCDGLNAAVHLSTGVHTLRLLSGDTPVYVDGDYNGGAWVLIGRGREGWTWDDAGAGIAATIKDGIGTSAAFSPTYLSQSIIQRLIDQTTPALDLTQLEIRLKRAAATDGTAYQEALWQMQSQTGWDWDFPFGYQVYYSVADSVLGPGAATITADTSDAMPGADDHTRLFTWALSQHNQVQGFSYGQSVGIGTNDANNFLWEYVSEGYAIPYTEVYLRVPQCTATTCRGHGSCDDSGGIAVCSCDIGYAGGHCESCDTGYNDFDHDGTWTAPAARASD
jgi:hypothetical protein